VLYVGPQSSIQSGIPTVPESGIKPEDGIEDIKPARVLTPPPNAPPPGSPLPVGHEMGTGGDILGQSAPHGPMPEAPQDLYDPTLYPPTDPVVPKRGRARALDFAPIDDPPTKKRRVEPPSRSASTFAQPSLPQPKNTTLFTANKSGPITRTRDGKYVPVPAQPKPRKWALSPEERVGLGLEPFIVSEVTDESCSGDGGSRISTPNLDARLNMNTDPRNPVGGRRHPRSFSFNVNSSHPHGSSTQATR
jgi:hypothetical protein